MLAFKFLFISTAWEGALLGSSPGDSIESFSGSSSPPLSDDGNVSSSSTSSSDQKYIIKQNHHKLQINQLNVMEHHARRGQRTTSLSTSDEGIVMDYGEEMQRKRRVSSFQFSFSIYFLIVVRNGHTQFLISWQCRKKAALSFKWNIHNLITITPSLARLALTAIQIGSLLTIKN